MPRRGTTLRQNNGRSTNNIGQSSEVRSSTRSVRKVSYVESEDSEDIDDGRNRRNQKVCYLVTFQGYRFSLNLFLFAFGNLVHLNRS